jgi:hypothetical protein
MVVKIRWTVQMQSVCEDILVDSAIIVVDLYLFYGYSLGAGGLQEYVVISSGLPRASI